MPQTINLHRNPVSAKGSEAKYNASRWVRTSSYNVAVQNTRYLSVYSTAIVSPPVEQAQLEMIKSESEILAEISCHCLWEFLLALHLNLDGGEGALSEHLGVRLEKRLWTELQGKGCGCLGVCQGLTQIWRCARCLTAGGLEHCGLFSLLQLWPAGLEARRLGQMRGRRWKPSPEAFSGSLLQARPGPGLFACSSHSKV